MQQRPHPKLSVARHGAQFPAELLAAGNSALPHILAGFALDACRDADGELDLPLGRAAANEYALATLSTARGDLAARLAGGAVKLVRFPPARSAARSHQH